MIRKTKPRKQLLFFLSIVLGCLAGACQQSMPDENSNNHPVPDPGWRVIGPGGGGGIVKPTISPFDDQLLMAHCDMTAAYLSSDGGNHWGMKNFWTVPEDFEFDPHNPLTIYVATRGYQHSEDRGSGLSTLLKSEDRGAHWEIIYPDLSNILVRDLVQTLDLLPSGIVKGAFDGTIDKVEVDPADPQRIYLGMAPLKAYTGPEKQNVTDSVMLVHSKDQGKSWSLLARVSGKNVRAIIPFTTGDQDHRVLVFSERAGSIVDIGTGGTTGIKLPAPGIIEVGSGRHQENLLIYLQTGFRKDQNGTTGGMYVSQDLGSTWIESNGGLLKGVATGKIPSFRNGLAVCETQANVAYISIDCPEFNNDGILETIYSIYKTVDGGRQWDPAMRSSTPGGYISGNFSGSWMEESFDPGWGGSPIDLGVAPGNPDVCFAGDNGRCYKTTNGGISWEQVYSENMPDGSFTSRGLDVTTCYGVHFDPFDKEHLFICYTDIGLFHTKNGGESWVHSINGIRREWQNTCYDLCFDPGQKGRLWSAWANVHDLPRSKMFGSQGFSHFKGGVALSEDGGTTWSSANDGLPEHSICTSILLDPSSPVDARTLYVGVFDRGVYKSVDGGTSWQMANKGLGENRFAWQLEQNADGRLFALVARGTRNSLTMDGKLYYSDDQANTWIEMKLPDGLNGPHHLLINPGTPEIMYLSCWPRDLGERDANGGVYKTGDGGASWSQIFDERIRVNAAALEPEHPETVYINTFHNAAYRSNDSGHTWNRLEGYRFKWGQQVFPDINHPGMLYLSSYGGSVFYGPSEGVPGAVDDIVNMPEGWW